MTLIDFEDIQEELIICRVLSELEKIEGRKKFQKMMFISKEFDAPIRFDFNFHYFGPYSEQLAFLLKGLKDKYLNENTYYDTYIYTPNEKCKTMINKIKDDLDEKLDLKKYIPLIRFLNDFSAKILELVSSIMYLKHFSSDKQDIEEDLKIMKAQHTNQDITTAFDLLEQIEQNFSHLRSK